MPLRIPWKFFQPRLPRGAGGKEDKSGGPETGPLPSIPQGSPPGHVLFLQSGSACTFRTKAPCL